MRLIDADRLLSDENTHTIPFGNGYASGRVFVYIEDIENAPTEDVQEVKHGKYMQGGLDGEWQCNLCHDRIYRMTIPEYRYCPHCGARMEEVQRND